jgi:Virulence-associated protein E/Bifunctional DNA primase/polymerase, N-terminal
VKASDQQAIYEAALELVSNWRSVIPIAPCHIFTDARGKRSFTQKRPAINEWGPYRDNPPTGADLEEWFLHHQYGLAMLCGKASHNVQIIDIEGRFDHMPAFVSDLEAMLPGVAQRLATSETPSRGRHMGFECEDMSGPKTFARNADGQVLIELRAEGNYIVVPPTPGDFHESGRGWTMKRGTFSELPRISSEDKNILFDICRSYNELPTREFSIPLPPRPDGKLRPGDDYNLRGDPVSVLVRHGWQIFSQVGQETRLTRPGKEISQGMSATWNHVPGKFHNFSSSVPPFEVDRSYSAFAVLTFLDYAGDFRASTKDLAEKGFGDKEPPPKPVVAVHPPLVDAAGVVLPDQPLPEKVRATIRSAVRLIQEQGLVDIRLDRFTDRYISGDPPREWNDAKTRALCIALQGFDGMERISLEIVHSAVLAIGDGHQVHTVKDWLETLSWDQIGRLDELFSDHFGTVNTKYMRSASKNFWLGMVSRVYRPGCQVDHMIVLEGKQGIGKSSALRIIGGDWYCEQHESAQDAKAFAEVLQGKLLVEISEMDSFNRAEVARVKQILTNTTDRYRTPFARHAEDRPRQCVFAGTINRSDWNRDETGARRFWPIACGDVIDCDAIAHNREQYFAEAVFRFKAGEKWWEMPQKETKAEQDKRYDLDPSWREAIVEYMRNQRYVTSKDAAMEILGIKLSDITRQKELQIASAFRHLGYEQVIKEINGKTTRAWQRKDDTGDDPVPPVYTRKKDDDEETSIF